MRQNATETAWSDPLFWAVSFYFFRRKVMKVQDLIEMLRGFNPTDEIVLYFEESEFDGRVFEIDYVVNQHQQAIIHLCEE